MRTLNINAKKKTDFINESRFWKFSKMRIFSDFRKMSADRGPKMRTNEQPSDCEEVVDMWRHFFYSFMIRKKLEPHDMIF